MMLSGLKLLVMGMGIVYSFLILMILLIKITHKLLNENVIEFNGIRNTRHNSINSDEELIAVIGSAIKKYKTRS